MKALFLSLFVLGGIGGTLSQTGTDVKNLRTQLFITDGYEKKMLPLTNQSFAVDVYVNFNLLAINGLDEVTETLKTTGYLWITWYDEYLIWDPAMYGGIQYYHFPQQDIWTPDVTLKNSILEIKELGTANLRIEVYNDGLVTWYPFQVFQSTCSVDITNFPFDVQNCHLTFMAWSYNATDVYMHGGSTGIGLEEYQESSLWEVVGSSWSTDDDSGAAVIKFTLKLKRKPLYFILSVIMPILMVAVLNVFVFTLPCESGERAGYAVTMFLALAVFLTIVADSLPANSETIAIFAIYVIIQTLQSTMITILALLTIRMSTKTTEVPRPLVKLMQFVQCLQCKWPKRSTKVGPNRTNKKFSVSVVHNFESSEPPYSVKSKVNSKKLPIQDKHEVPEPREDVSWSLAVRALDFCLFVLFLTCFIVSTTVCFGITGTSR